jgi:hypothetical protein
MTGNMLINGIVVAAVDVEATAPVTEITEQEITEFPAVP